MPKQRLEFIDALRGLAASYVVMYHLALLPKPNLNPPQWMQTLVLNGGSGVVLFFVLSAFTMCLTMQNRRKQAGAVRTFYIRRLLRIAPLFYTLLLVTLIFNYVFFEQIYSLFEVLLSLVFGFNLIPGYTSGIVMASWTIGVEMIFYLVFPLIFKFVTTLCHSLAFLVITHAIDVVYSHFLSVMISDTAVLSAFNHKHIVHQFPVFAQGICVFYLYKHLIQLERNLKPQGWLLIILGGVFYYQLISGLSLPAGDNWHWQALAYSIIIIGMAMAQPLVFINRFTMFIGNISYSLYLNHPILILALLVLTMGVSLPTESGWFYLFALLCVFTLLIPVSYLSCRIIEKPAIDFSHRLTEKAKRQALSEKRSLKIK